VTRHQRTQVAQIQSTTAQRRQAIQQSAAAALLGLNRAVDAASRDVTASLVALVQMVNSGDQPDPDQLGQTLQDAGARLDAELTQVRGQLTANAGQAGRAAADAAAQAATARAEAGQAAIAAADQTGAAAQQALGTAGTHGRDGLARIASGHAEVAKGAEASFTTGATTVTDSVATSYQTISTNFAAGATHQADAVREGLTNAVLHDMPGVIETEAEKARDQVQPRWKSVLKWIIIIAIVLVVALVLGPLVIGAVTGAAAALGASAGAASLIGMVVGGALVGAATSAATTVTDNAFAGRDLTTGLGTAIAVGALGGALGGAASGLLAGPMQGMSALARYGVQVGVDVVIDTGINAATGNLTWENFATGLVMSAFVNGVTAHPRVQAFQHGMTSRGYGAGFKAGTAAYTRYTGRGGPGSAGTLTIDASHVNVGDTASPTSPYRGTWDMRGGGHNAAEIRGRATSEGMTNTTTAKDPHTGVAIDHFERPALDSAGNPIPDATVPGGVKIKSVDKSLFPESMGRPEIESAASGVLERAIAGAPGTQHTAPGVHPNGQPKNGTFSGTMVTPDGHPIRVEGYYGPAAGGGLEIKTVYPATDLPGGRIPPVPGSQVSVPGGVVTPPDYDHGDEE
jgi:hypothetical protein